MIEAMLYMEQFACRVPTPDAVKSDVLYCSTSATNALDIWVAVGTVGATIAAVTFGVIELVRGRRGRQRQAKADRQLQLSQQYQSIAMLVRQISWEFPFGNLNLITLLQSEIGVYEQLIKLDEDVDQRISAEVVAVCRKFAGISWTHSNGVHPASMYYNEGWEQHVASYGSLLRRIQFAFETTLTPWHLTRQSGDEVSKTLLNLDKEIEETYAYYLSQDQHHKRPEQSPSEGPDNDAERGQH